MTPQSGTDRNACPTRTHYPDSKQTSLCSLCCALSGEATNTNFIVFGVTRSGLEPTIYLTLGGSEKITVFGVTRSGLEPTIYLTLGESEKITVFGVTRSGLEPTIYLTLGESEKITFRVNVFIIERMKI